MSSSNPTAFKRSGLHRVECECGAYLYGTIACLEAYGLPVCACGQAFTPARREVAEILGVENHDTAAYAAAVASGLPAERVAEFIETRRAEQAKARRLAALRAA